MVIFALTLIRHGETGHNKDNVIQGQLDVPLSSTGIEQARRLGHHLQHQKYTHVFSSDLTRAKLTAECVLEKSQVCQVPIIEDNRLRERKFGVVEGKSFKFLKEAASKSNQSVVHMTPAGAETVQQVRERATSFFRELCQSICLSELPYACKPSDTSPTTNGASDTPHNNQTSRTKRKREDSCDKNHSKNLEGTKNKSSNQTTRERPLESLKMETVSPTFTDEVIRTHLTPGKYETEDSDCPNVSLSPLVSHNSRANVVNDENAALATAEDIIIEASQLKGDLIIFPVQSTEQRVDGALQAATEVLAAAAATTERERRLSICSSNDENDVSPDLIANVMVVSHGGLLKEMVKYFVEDLGCWLPGGTKQAMRISPNAGLSKFTVSLDVGGDEEPKIICHQIHEKHYLTDYPAACNVKELLPEATAL